MNPILFENVFKNKSRLPKNFGSSLYVTANNQDLTNFGNILLSNTSVTAAIWVNFRTDGSSNYDVCFGYGGVARWFFIRNGAAGQRMKVAFNIKIGGSEKGSNYIANNLDYDKWYLLIGTYNSNGGSNNLTIRVYDSKGRLYGSNSSTQTGDIDTTGNSLFVGRDVFRNTSCDANFDEARVYSSVLTVAQQNALARNIEPPTNTLIGYWKWDEGSGTNVIDYSGSGNNGTIIGSAATYSSNVPNTA